MKYGIQYTHLDRKGEAGEHGWMKSQGDWLLFDTEGQAAGYLQRLEQPAHMTYVVAPFTAPPGHSGLLDGNRPTA